MPNDQEYCTTLISLMEADKKQMMLLIGVEIGVPLLTIKDLAFGKVIFDPSNKATPDLQMWLGLSVLLFFAAALFHWLYMRRIHMNTFAVARIMLESGKGALARERVFCPKTGLFAKHGYKFILGMFLFVAGISTYCVFVWTYLKSLQ